VAIQDIDYVSMCGKLLIVADNRSSEIVAVNRFLRKSVENMEF
jgi:hypothetical protein